MILILETSTIMKPGSKATNHPPLMNHSTKNLQLLFLLRKKTSNLSSYILILWGIPNHTPNAPDFNPQQNLSTKLQNTTIVPATQQEVVAIRLQTYIQYSLRNRLPSPILGLKYQSSRSRELKASDFFLWVKWWSMPAWVHALFHCIQPCDHTLCFQMA
jgi:hypothetical protein